MNHNAEETNESGNSSQQRKAIIPYKELQAQLQSMETMLIDLSSAEQSTLPVLPMATTGTEKEATISKDRTDINPDLLNAIDKAVTGPAPSQKKISDSSKATARRRRTRSDESGETPTVETSSTMVQEEMRQPVQTKSHNNRQNGGRDEGILWELEKRITQMERRTAQLMSSKDNMRPLSLHDLTQTVLDLETRISLLDPAIIGTVQRRITKLATLIKKVISLHRETEKMKTTALNTTGTKDNLHNDNAHDVLTNSSTRDITKLITQYEKQEGLVDILPLVIGRLRTLDAFHSRAFTFEEKIRTIESNQREFNSQLNNQEENLQKLETLFETNAKTLSKNIKSLEKKIKALKKKTGK
eukprot:g696.t1